MLRIVDLAVQETFPSIDKYSLQQLPPAMFTYQQQMYVCKV